jgi:quercetin dioxygenase-like cupin family protein
MILPRILPSAILLLILAGSAPAEESKQYGILLTPVLQSGETIIGQPVVYPTGTPKVATAIVVLPPGKETGWHLHEVPLFAYVLEGEVTVDYGDKGIKLYKTGEGILEGMNWPHNGMNKGTVPARILAVYMGAEGKANAEPAKGPQ